jgi:hypothetical protein
MPMYRCVVAALQRNLLENCIRRCYIDAIGTEMGGKDMDIWCDCGFCGDNLSWELLGDALFINGKGKMYDYLPGNSIWTPMAWYVRSVVIGKGATSIGAYAFWDFTALTSVSLPWSVTEFGEGAFPDRQPLPEITGSGIQRYCTREGMLIDRTRGLPVWPLEMAAKRGSRFAVAENDCIFRIETGRHSTDGTSGIGCFGDSNTLIEIRESRGWIIDIECIYLKPTLREPNLFLPDYRCNPELEETECFFCPDYAYETRHPCVVNVVRDRMEIILSENLDDISCYHVEGRVEYYCDSQRTVVLIRISDLTEEEFRVLGR